MSCARFRTVLLAATVLLAHAAMAETSDRQDEPASRPHQSSLRVKPVLHRDPVTGINPNRVKQIELFLHREPSSARDVERLRPRPARTYRNRIVWVQDGRLYSIAPLGRSRRRDGVLILYGRLSGNRAGYTSWLEYRSAGSPIRSYRYYHYPPAQRTSIRFEAGDVSGTLYLGADEHWRRTETYQVLTPIAEPAAAPSPPEVDTAEPKETAGTPAEPAGPPAEPAKGAHSLPSAMCRMLGDSGKVNVPCAVGDALMRLGDYERAAQYYAQASAEQPERPAYAIAEGVALMASGHFAPAAEALRCGLASHPRPSDIGLEPESIFPAGDAYEAAAGVLMAVAGEQPESADMQFLAGFHYFANGDCEMAAEHFGRASALDPQDEVAGRMHSAAQQRRLEAKAAPEPSTDAPE